MFDDNKDIQYSHIFLCCSTYLNRSVLCRWTLLCNLHTVSAPALSWGIKDPLMRCNCKVTINSITSEFNTRVEFVFFFFIFLFLSNASSDISHKTKSFKSIFPISRYRTVLIYNALQLPAISDVKVHLLHVESVSGVLRLDSGNGPSLHVHGVGANPRHMHPCQVFQELRVALSGHVRLIEPGRLTGCRRRLSAINSASF